MREDDGRRPLAEAVADELRAVGGLEPDLAAADAVDVPRAAARDAGSRGRDDERGHEQEQGGVALPNV